MTANLSPGDLAFVGPNHISQLAEFQYVEVVTIADGTVTVKVVGPDAEENGDGNTLSVPVETLQNRVVPAHERDLWPGSLLAHPVAFPRTSTDGVDVWAYGVVSGYDTSEQSATLHVICPNDSVRLRLTTATTIIKVDVLNYALQTGAGVNTTAVNPTELLDKQNKIIAACQRWRSGLPKEIVDSATVPFKGGDLLPLIRPSTLELVRVTRQHIVDYKTAARTKRPENLYVTHETASPTVAKRSRAADRQSSQSSRPAGLGAGESVRRMDESAGESEEMALSSSSEDENIRDVQHMHRPLSKRRRIDREDIGSDHSSSSDQDESSYAWDKNSKGVVFHPSPSDRRAHSAIVRLRHAGKEPQMLLQSAQQSEHVDFIATPPVLRGAYCFGFGVGLSIMHFRRALTADEVATTERGMNMWDFSARNALAAPPRATKIADLTSALSSFYKFAKYFYNKATRKFIGTARDFIISYADSAPIDPAMARLLAHWINTKFSKFRSRLVTKGIRSALRVRKEFSRNDEQLSALKEAYPSWKITTAANNSHRSGVGKKADSRQHNKERIPFPVIESLPKGDDGRRLCLRYVSKAGCNVTDCARAHFKPASLTEETKTVIAQRWKGLSEECKDL
ncbi:hypothetical protein F442_04574 [Phytophthora nicotianae P10297]|uniref:C3H1-type domain-containing protein n=1 Tax=Phytophthora nicotianae P10297 TaxID=1317064 RepID=W2ZRM6_PHYNI|nr:hypothetical protein F442_04574 [Phytophthora nicotianae P10297]